MGCHLYCIVPAGHAPEGARTRGAGDVAVARIPVTTTLDAWVTHHDERTAPSLEAVRTHNDVILSALTPLVTPVPVRFGQWLADDAAVAGRAAAQQQRWEQLLRALAGHAEFGVTIQLAIADDADGEQDVHRGAGGSGTGHMRALALRQARTSMQRAAAGQIAGTIDDRVGNLAADRRVDLQRAGQGAVSVAFLVAWDAVQDYHRAVQGISVPDGSRILFTGPWPPYSFVDD